MALIVQSNLNWIFDCGVTDLMSFDVDDFVTINPPHKKYIQTAK